MDIYFTDTQFVRFIFDPDFYVKYGDKQYAFYECTAEDDDTPHYANIYLPTDLSYAELAGTIGYEVTRLVLDWHQTQIATLHGKIVQAFMEKYNG